MVYSSAQGTLRLTPAGRATCRTARPAAWSSSRYRASFRAGNTAAYSSQPSGARVRSEVISWARLRWAVVGAMASLASTLRKSRTRSPIAGGSSTAVVAGWPSAPSPVLT